MAERKIHREAGAFFRRSGGTACPEAVTPLFSSGASRAFPARRVSQPELRRTPFSDFFYRLNNIISRSVATGLRDGLANLY